MDLNCDLLGGYGGLAGHFFVFISGSIAIEIHVEPRQFHGGNYSLVASHGEFQRAVPASFTGRLSEYQNINCLLLAAYLEQIGICLGAGERDSILTGGKDGVFPLCRRVKSEGADHFTVCENRGRGSADREQAYCNDKDLGKVTHGLL